MLTRLQSARVLELLHSEELARLEALADSPELVTALHAKHSADIDAAEAALKAELGGRWSQAFRDYEQAAAAYWSDCESTAFLRGLFAGALPLARALFPDPAEDHGPARLKPARRMRQKVSDPAEAEDMAEAGEARLRAELSEAQGRLLTDILALARYAALFGSTPPEERADLAYMVGEILDEWPNYWPGKAA